MREQFEQQVGSKYRGILEIDYAYQDKKDLPMNFRCPQNVSDPGNRPRSLAARDAIKGSSFAVINVDDYYGVETFEALIKSFQATTLMKRIIFP